MHSTTGLEVSEAWAAAHQAAQQADIACTDVDSTANTAQPAQELSPRPRTRRQKRLAQEAVEASQAQRRVRRKVQPQVVFSLYVRWSTGSERTKVTHLQLKAIDSVGALKGVAKSLLAKAFPEDQRPEYLTSEDFQRFTPVEEFMSIPTDIVKTEFRLVATIDDWEYTVLERELGAHRDPERNMLVTVIEFESAALMVGRLGLRVNLIAYPVVSLRKGFIEAVEERVTQQHKKFEAASQ